MSLSGLEESLKSLMTELYSRNFMKNPLSDKSLIYRKFRELSISNSPIRIICYWGCYVDKLPDKNEREFIELLTNLRSLIISNLNLNCVITYIFTDTHARLNGVSESTTQKYGAYLNDYFSEVDIEFIPMSNLDGYVSKQKLQSQGNLPEHFSSILRLLEQQSEALHGHIKAREYAKKYLVANIYESSLVAKTWPSAVFYNHSLPQLNAILPTLPIMQGYTGINGKTKKPWFRKERS